MTQEQPRRLSGLLLLATAGLVGALAVGPSTGADPGPVAVLEQARSGTLPVGLETAPARAVPAPEPVALRVPGIGLETALVPLGLDEQGRLEVPEGYEHAGWFAEGVLPGDPGPAVVVGHVDSRDGPAVFYRLRALGQGDEVVVVRTDGSTVRFAVERVERHEKERFPTEAVYGPTTGPELRLVTCVGAFDREAGSYEENLVVYATLAPDPLTPPSNLEDVGHRGG